MKTAIAAACTVALVFTVGGEAVADDIDGTTGDDRLYGTNGPDQIIGRSGDDAIFGRDGRDGLSGGPGRDMIVGAARGDDISGGLLGDYIEGNRGHDWIVDWVATEFGPNMPVDHDRLFGGPGNDHIGFGNGRDLVRGGPGADELRTTRDAYVDDINCGAGTHDVLAYYGKRDRTDVVRGCERIVVRG
ncbi:MAG: hypothetical protein WKF76_08650 [Nocardioidaceae bacterium]